jgi:glycosyltransferase AglD
MSKPYFSLILPCFNEAEHFLTSADKIYKTLNKLKQRFEIIFIDDASKDNTQELIKVFITKHPQNSRAIYHRKNQGRGRTVADGLLSAQGVYAGFIDIDCEISPTYIPACLDLLDRGYDLVCGQRKYQVTSYGFIRAVASKTYSVFIGLLLHPIVKDTEAGYKFFQLNKIIPVLSKIKSNGWFWDTEIIIRAQNSGLKIAGLDVKFLKRSDKTSTVHLLNDTITYLIQAFRFKLELVKQKYAYENCETDTIDNYWQKKSSAFSNQYQHFLGIPLSWVGWFLKLRYDKITQILKDLNGNVFVDVGCGSGIFMEWAISKGMYAYGLDYSQLMIETARSHLHHYPNNKYQLIQADAAKIPLISNSADLILASGLTDYLTQEKTQIFFKEIGRILKKDGYAVITFPKKESPLKFLRSGFGLWLRENFLHLPPMETAYTKERIIQLFEIAKLVPVKWDEVLFTMRIVVGKKYAE